MTAAEGAKSAAAGDLTGKTPVGVTAVEPTEDGWRVEIEVVEESHTPSTSDLMALYELDLDQDGELAGSRRGNIARRAASSPGIRGGWCSTARIWATTAGPTSSPRSCPGFSSSSVERGLASLVLSRKDLGPLGPLLDTR